jgi:hypothetical protein
VSPAPTDFSAPRELGDLVEQTFELYGRHARVFLTLAAIVVLPVQFIWGGFGLGELTGGYDEHVPAGLDLLDTAIGILVTTPLITAMHVTAVLDLTRGDAPSVRRSAQVALDAFPMILGAMLIYVAGVALGLVLLVVPGIYWAVRWYFVTQAVVVEGRRGAGALEESARLVDGSWWRLVGIGVVFNLIVAPLGVAAGIGVRAAARSADAGIVELAGYAVVQTITLSFLALATTLVYLDLRLRREGAAPTGAVPGGAPFGDEGGGPVG